METNEKLLKKAVKILTELKEKNEDLLLKIYFYDDENYCFKFIDTKLDKKIHTIRKNKNHHCKGLDYKGYMKKYGKPQE